MSTKISFAIGSMLLALSLSDAALAQGPDRARDRTRDPATEQGRIGDRAPDRDRTADRDRIQDRDFDRDQDRDQERDRDRLRDPLHMQDRDQLRTRDIYGSELMTRRERSEYRERLEAMSAVQEWARFRAEHQQRMTARAQERRVELPPPFYGQHLMTDQERLRLRERLQEAANEQERTRIMTEHRQQMQERAREHQIPVDELDVE